MSKNIKEIGKELMGKSLNSFHRKTGLTQLEKNNEIQDGILDGILSQVDDAYIEKTEQSNVIHLDGSGDGVVVLDSIEGNTMVNHINSQSLRDWKYTHNTYTGQYANTQEFGIDWSKEVSFNCWLQARNDLNPIFSTLKPNTDYTVWINILENNPTLNGASVTSSIGALQLWINGYQSIRQSLPINTTGWVSLNYRWTREDSNINYSIFGLSVTGTNSDGTKTVNGGKLRISKEVVVLEGLDVPLNSYFEGLQSSFEEKVNNEGKYEIEILSNNKNMFNPNDLNLGSWSMGGGVKPTVSNGKILLNGTVTGVYDFRAIQATWNQKLSEYVKKMPVGTTLTMSNNLGLVNYWSVKREGVTKYPVNTLTIQEGDSEIGAFVRFTEGMVLNNTELYIQIENSSVATDYIPQKQNKIKLLTNEPLRSVGEVKDRLCVKDNKLVVERKCLKIYLNGQEDWTTLKNLNSMINVRLKTDNYDIDRTNFNNSTYNTNYMLSDKKIATAYNTYNCLDTGISINRDTQGYIDITINKSELSSYTINNFKNWLSNNPYTLIVIRNTPFYEEVLNEYGEPIVLEGYENGTIYIDSTIVPTTTVRYTPKMESFKTLNEVTNNNVMLTNDINDAIIPYMMNIDLMIMEKEMALPSQINMRTMEVLDMTSMQKRTQDMLERLIKGKTLTEQQCKDRVVVYLNANKITSEQADELMVLISEIYA